MSEYIVRETCYPLTGGKQEVVSELVRCKDCKHWTPYIANGTNGMGDELCPMGFSREDEYCSRGERKVQNERCENCKWYREIDCDDEWVCTCLDSAYCAEPVDYLDYCKEWEKKHEEE